MQRANPRRPRGFLQKRHRLPTPAAPAILLAQIELVDERIAAQPFEAVANAQHDVSYGRVAIQNQPREAELGIAEQARQSPPSLLAIEPMSVKGVILLHEFQKGIGVRLDRQS